MLYPLIRTIFFLLLISTVGFAQNPTNWSLGPLPTTEKLNPGDKAQVTLNVTVEPGWHLYALDQPAGGPIATTIKIAEGKPFELVGVKSQTPITKPDPLFIVDGKPLETRYFVDQASFTLSVNAGAPTSL